MINRKQSFMRSLVVLDKSMVRIFFGLALLAAGLAYIVAPINSSDAATAEPPVVEPPPPEPRVENPPENLSKQIDILSQILSSLKRENEILTQENTVLKRLLKQVGEDGSKKGFKQSKG